MTNNKKRMFLQEVTNQIRSKEAKDFVAKELGYHIQEAKKTWKEKGLPDSEAEEKAIEQMGSPTKLGIQLNMLHRPKVDWWMVLLLGIALLLGFLPLFTVGNTVMSEYLLVTKGMIVLVGVFLAIGMMMVDYRKWQKRGWLFYTLGILILLAIRYIPNRMINGVPRIEIGSLTIESLMAIPFFLFAWASFFHHPKLKVWKCVILFLIPLILQLAIPSMTTAYIYVIMVFAMLCWSRFSRKSIMVLFTAAIGILLVIGITSIKFLKEYQKERFLAFIHPEDYPDGAGYLVLQIKKFLANAGWFGNPLGKEMIPEDHTNFVLVNFTYHYGWLSTLILIAVLSFFAIRMVFVMFHIKDAYGKSLLIGAVALYCAQLATNVAMSFGLFPFLDVALPFMSYGLMPTLLNAILIGIVLSVYRRKDMRAIV